MTYLKTMQLSDFNERYFFGSFLVIFSG